MSLGSVIKTWWQDYAAGRLRTPQAIVKASREALPDNRFFGAPADGVRFDAPARLAAPMFMHTPQALKQYDAADWQHADSRLMLWAAKFVTMARERGIPLFVHCCFRDKETQNRLVRQGVSRTLYPTSAHNISEAVDIVHGVFFWEMSEAEWNFLHVLGQRALELVNAKLGRDRALVLEWGGNWSRPYDPAHWQIADYRTRSRVLPVGEPVRRTPAAIVKEFGRWPKNPNKVSKPG